MCEIWEEIRNEGLIEGKMEASIENAKSMIKFGKLSLNGISQLKKTKGSRLINGSFYFAY